MYLLLNYNVLTGDLVPIGVYNSLLIARAVKPLNNYYSVIYKQFSNELRVIEAPFM